MNLKELNSHKTFRNLVTFVAVVVAAFMQASIIQIFYETVKFVEFRFYWRCDFD